MSTGRYPVLAYKVYVQCPLLVNRALLKPSKNSSHNTSDAWTLLYFDKHWNTRILVQLHIVLSHWQENSWPLWTETESPQLAMCMATTGIAPSLPSWVKSKTYFQGKIYGSHWQKNSWPLWTETESGQLACMATTRAWASNRPVVGNRVHGSQPQIPTHRHAQVHWLTLFLLMNWES